MLINNCKRSLQGYKVINETQNTPFGKQIHLYPNKHVLKEFDVLIYACISY